MLFKLGFYQFQKNWIMKILVIAQLVFVFVAAIIGSSVYSYHTQYYKYFEDYFSSEGMFLFADCVYQESGDWMETDMHAFEGRLRNAKVLSMATPGFAVKNMGRANALFLECEGEILERYQPELEEGIWFSRNETEDTVLHLVVSQNDFGWKTGTELELVTSMGSALKAEVIGVLKEGARIVGIANSKMGYPNDYTNLYAEVYREESLGPLFILDNRQLSMIYNECGIRSDSVLACQMLIQYGENITDEDIRYNESYIEQHVDVSYRYDMKTIRENSINNIKQKLIVFVPIYVAAFVFAIISVISTTAITVKRQLKNYAIYNVLGLPWRYNAIINATDTGITVAISIGIAFVGTALCMGSGCVDNTTIMLDRMQVVVCLITGIIYIVLAMIIPTVMIRKMTAKEILNDS